MEWIRKHKTALAVFLLAIFTSLLLLSVLRPNAGDRFDSHNIKTSKENQAHQITAIGDSLTEGVGDSTNEGGYLPLLQRSLNDEFTTASFTVVNYGVSGNRTDQIIKRIKKDETLQEEIKAASLITLTTGGNDLMKVIQSQLFSTIEVKSFKAPSENYQKNLEKLYTLIRSYNKQAPIYQLGVYNPFYKSFSDITAMQEVVDLWNDAAKEVIKEQEESVFVPINEFIAEGLASTMSSTESESINNLLSDTDNFHPNNLGYQIIANQFKEKIMATKNYWE